MLLYTLARAYLGPNINNFNNFMSICGVQTEAIAQKFLGRSDDETQFSNADNRKGRNKTGRSQSTTFKSFDLQKKGSKGIIFDTKEQQVHYKDQNF